MRRNSYCSWLTVLLLLLTLGTAWAVPPVGSGGQDDFAPPDLDPDAVTAQLLSSSKTVAAGSTLELGIHLHMKPGWHTYWQNGGDAGLPTSVSWTLPQGLKAGEIQWPTPHRYVEGGDLVTYGYMDDVLLLTKVEVPAELPAKGSIEIKAKVTWLMCKALCVPGQAELSLQLPVAASSEPDSSVREIFLQAHERLPRTASEYEGMQSRSYLSLNAVPLGQSAHAAFVVEGPVDFSQAEYTWFPEAHPGIQCLDPNFERQDGKLTVLLPFTVNQDATEGKDALLAGVLELTVGPKHWYLQLKTQVPVAGESKSIQAMNPEIFDPLTAADTATGATAAAGPLWRFLLLALLGGLILNVMPCVLPVLSLKVMSFVTHSDRDRATVLKLSLVFALGVLASFLALALTVIALQSAGELLGWGFQFQNPTFVVVMIAIVFGFGLSLFGLFEVIPPAGSFQGGRGSLYGEQFFNGMLATILATPCSAPFLGSALGFAFTQQPVDIIAIFLTIGLGLASPYVLLSINPAWLRFVPKPGPWMERFKQFMGFLLMATVVWLLWVVAQQLGSSGMVHVLWFILVLALALWIHGAYLSLSSSVPRRVFVWVLTLVLVVGGWRVFLSETLSAEGIARAQASTGTEVAQRVEGIEWVPFSPDALQEAVSSGKTVFVDFTAAWCLTCKANERAVIDSREVTDKLKELKVVTMLGDWTQRDPVISEVLREHGRSGVPFYAVFPAEGFDDPIVLPEVINKTMVVDALQQAGASRK